MIKYIKTAFLLLMQMLLIHGVNGQKSAEITGLLKGRFEKYINAVPREEIYVHTDRDEYISGENLWFDVFLVDRLSSKPSTGSRIAYLELLNQENRPVVQKKVLLEEGSGPGQAVLPDTLSTGRYTLRAYTNWMKNFFPYNCFVKEILVYNAFSDRKIRKANEESIKALRDISHDFGLTFDIDNRQRDQLDISITADESYRRRYSSQIILFIQTHGKINLVNSEVLTGETTKISLSKSQLSPGINQIAFFNTEGKLVGERFIYTPKNDSPVSGLQCNDTIQRRKKVLINLDLGKEYSNILNSGLSISVAPETNNHSMMDLNDYMVFGSEFGFLPAKTIQGRKLDAMPPSAIDSLLQSLTSNWINWNQILANELPVLKYQMEKEDCYLSGRLISGEEKKGDAGKFVLLSTPGKTAIFQYAVTDVDGKFTFNIHLDGKVKDLIIQPDIVTRNQIMNIGSPFSDQYVPAVKSLKTPEAGIPGYITSWGINRQVMAIYGNNTAGEPVVPVLPLSNPKRFYGKPDNALIMKDYIKLPVMQEVFFELLQGVSLDNKRTGWEITVNDPFTRHPYEIPPSLFIDGVKIKDPSLIAAIDPENVEEIDVIRDKYYVGDYLFYGVVNIITNAADFSNSTLPSYAIRLPYRSIDPVSKFIAPDYSLPDRTKNHVPDFRNTLYWDTAVRTDQAGKATVEFWASDFVSDYEIQVQGFTSDGNIISLKKHFRIK